MKWPRSVGGRLSLALLLVVAGALGIVYLVVVPSLRARLVDARIGEVRADATAVRRAFDARPKDPDVISNSAARANVRLVRFQSQPPLLSVVDDSRQGPTNSADIAQDPLALEAATTSRPAAGPVKRDGQLYAE